MTTQYRREILFIRLCLAATVVGFLAILGSLAHYGWMAHLGSNERRVAEAVGFSVIFLYFGYCAVLYHLALIGNYKRMIAHKPATREELDAFYEAGAAPALTTIIPSYKEERSVNWATMMSAALSEYPGKNVVLLIDDPYTPKVLEDIIKLEDTRKLPGELQADFNQELAYFRTEQAAFLARTAKGELSTDFERAHLAAALDRVAAWLEAKTAEVAQGRDASEMNHADRFMRERILLAPAAAHRAHAAILRAESTPLTETYLARQYARLVGLFDVRFSSFERKKYANLSHEANKAMNLNSYIALIGKSWGEVETPDGLFLIACPAEQADFTVPHADYINTIDSDTLMLSDYSLRIVQMMEQPGNERIAVAQSPCSVIPGAEKPTERFGSAVIDVQFRTHQGYTYWGASFWVGANAMLRHTAMEQIKETALHNGHPVSIYIQDRTVIEDTESSIDLVEKGWTLYNYPDRMTFSAMPPDFGSLLIQRRRWSNGGLLILPKLFSYFRRAPKTAALMKEMLMRFNYLAGTTIATVFTFVLAAYPSDANMLPLWFSLASLPPTVLLARDMKNTGFKYSDLWRVVSANFMLMPVAMGGVMKQFQQMLTGKKIPFGRTPKVPGRTVVPALYCVAELGLFLLCTLGMVRHAMNAEWTYAVAGAAGSFLFGYAIVTYIGVKALFEDMFAGLRIRWRNNFHHAQIIPLPTRTPARPLVAALALRKRA